jgi:hypothetical protein
MIKFFRKFRYDLMKKNETGKYFKYAIGEIILVVIGILIALSINNWNEERKNNRIETVFLEDFRSDLRTDIETLRERVGGNAAIIANSDSIISTLSNKKQLSKKELVNFYNQNLSLASESYFIPEKTTINQFQASNNGHLISSKELKDKLFGYYSTNERIENNMEKSIQLYQHNFLTKEIMQSILSGDVMENIVGSDFGRPNLDLNNLKQNSEYLFSVLSKKIGTTNQNKVYQIIIDLSEELITLIDLEIKQ